MALHNLWINMPQNSTAALLRTVIIQVSALRSGVGPQSICLLN